MKILQIYYTVPILITILFQKLKSFSNVNKIPFHELFFKLVVLPELLWILTSISQWADQWPSFHTLCTRKDLRNAIVDFYGQGMSFYY